ncbi:peptide-methionine (R)-S-oxide reductase MsrB [Oceaniferula flava]|nr:peptide-methionine (R)-S-oxide reductase MsrB [Oceaniferula flavus]
MKSTAPLIRRLFLLIFSAGIAFHSLAADPKKPMSTSEEPPAQPEKKVTKSDADWKKELTPEQYRVARQSGTEMPNGEVYQQFKKQGSGTYYCVACNAKLFSSKEKFDARCGWPSFYDPANAKNVKTLMDPDGMRLEVRCNVCDAHLGHVFSGEGFNTPTDKRYCINGIVLKFVPDRATDEKPDSKTKK